MKNVEGNDEVKNEVIDGNEENEGNVEKEPEWLIWLQENRPNRKEVQMNECDYPQFVKEGISNNWVKINNSGKWCEPKFHRVNYTQNDFIRNGMKPIKVSK